MSATRWPLLFLYPMLVSGALGQPAQRGEPRIGYVYPAGGQRGTTFEATLGGRNLYATGVYVSGAGVKATILKQERQVTPAEQMALRETLGKIQEKRKQGQWITANEAEQARTIREKLNKFGRRLSNPSLGEFVTLRITVAPTAAIGNREIRLETRAGLSNPIVFHVGELPEVTKQEWKNTPKRRGSMDAQLDPKPPEKSVDLPVTVNGQIPPGGVDRYRFSLQKGQQLTVVVRARELIPYISDAVPGWFQATAVLCDAQGHELVYADEYRFHPDPVLFYKAAATGDYVLHIRDALYRGREDFVYRITIGELPFVTAIFPLGAKVDTQATVAADGWNLPFRELPLDLRGTIPGIHTLSLAQVANSMPVAVDTLADCSESEPNNTLDGAQAVQLPTIINGRIDEPGDMDVFRFDGKQGDEIVAEVYARRLDSPLDSLLMITDADGNRLGFNDDHEDKGSGLNTHHADAYLAIELPATGSYLVHLGDTQQGGGRAYGYRLRISEPRPDFRLRVTPSSVNVHGGASAALTAHALRRDGFSGPIALRLRDAPPGFTLTGAQILERQDEARFTLNAAPPRPVESFNLCIEGHAIIQGRQVVRSAIPAEDMTQSFAYHHLVPAQEQKVTVTGRYRPGKAASILSPTPVKIRAGRTGRVRVSMPAGPMISKIDYELSQPPDGIAIKRVTSLRGSSEIVLQTDATKVKPGMKGNLIVMASAAAPVGRGEQGSSGTPRRIALGALPAIAFEILKP